MDKCENCKNIKSNWCKDCIENNGEENHYISLNDEYELEMKDSTVKNIQILEYFVDKNEIEFLKYIDLSDNQEYVSKCEEFNLYTLLQCEMGRLFKEHK